MSIALIISLCALLVNTLTVVVLYRDNKEHNKISKQIDAQIKEIDKQNKTFEKNRSQPLEVIIRK